MNKITYIGRVGRDLELKHISESLTVSETSIAQERRQGRDEYKTQWVNVSFRNKGNFKLAEYAARDIKKGDDIQVEGELVINERDGKSFTSIDVERFNIVSTAETREVMRLVMKARKEQTPPAQQTPIASYGTHEPAMQNW